MTNTLNRAEETTDKAGTGASVNLLGATSGRSTFAVAASIQVVTGNVYATIETDDGTIWETGIYTLGSGVLTRVSVLATSLGDTNPIDFPAGSHRVFSAQPNQALVAAGDVVGRIAANQIHTITGGSFGNLSVDAANFNLFAANTLFQGAGTIGFHSDTSGSGSATLDVNGASSQISLNATEDSSGNIATVELTGTYAELSNYNGTTATSARAGSNLFQVHVGTNQRIRADTVGVGLSTNAPNEAATVGGALSLQTMTAPSATAGHGKIYVKTSDGLPYYKDPAGVETAVLGGGLPDVTGPTVLGRVTGTGAVGALTAAEARGILELEGQDPSWLEFLRPLTAMYGVPGFSPVIARTRATAAEVMMLTPLVLPRDRLLSRVFFRVTAGDVGDVDVSVYEAIVDSTGILSAEKIQDLHSEPYTGSGTLAVGVDVSSLNVVCRRGRVYLLAVSSSSAKTYTQYAMEGALPQIVETAGANVFRAIDEVYVSAASPPPASLGGVGFVSVAASVRPYLHVAAVPSFSEVP